MMRALSLLSLVLIAGAFLTACSDESAPTQALQSDAPSQLGASKNGPPSSSGPIVLRYEDIVILSIIDDKTGVGVFFGGDFAALCTGDLSGFSRASIKEIHIPEDVNRLNLMIKGDDVQASLWDPFPATCADVLTGAPVATGTADLVYTDNDLVSFLYPDNVNANAFGLNAHGVLQTPSGETLRLSAHVRYSWDAEDPASFKWTSKINVH